MSWHPSDLVTNADLAAYENQVMQRFGQSDWSAKVTKALEDWLFPTLKARGFDPFRLRTRLEPALVLTYTSSAFADRTADARSTDADDLNLATILAASTDYLYVGLTQPFRGVHVRMLDQVSSAAAVLTAQYWADAWTALTVADGTAKTTGKPFSGGGSLTWGVPTDWSVRKVNNSADLYWVRLSLSAAPTGAKATQLGGVRASVFRAPVALRTLQLIFREAPTGQDGPWLEKAEFYKDEADAALTRALEICGGEFDTDASDQISADEADQTPEEAGGGWQMERG